MTSQTDGEALRMLYEVTTADLTYFKTQQWSVTYYAFLINAGLTGVAQLLGSSVKASDRAILTVLAGGAAVACAGIGPGRRCVGTTPVEAAVRARKAADGPASTPNLTVRPSPHHRREGQERGPRAAPFVWTPPPDPADSGTEKVKPSLVLVWLELRLIGLAPLGGRRLRLVRRAAVRLGGWRRC